MKIFAAIIAILLSATAANGQPLSSYPTAVPPAGTDFVPLLRPCTPAGVGGCPATGWNNLKAAIPSAMSGGGSNQSIITFGASASSAAQTTAALAAAYAAGGAVSVPTGAWNTTLGSTQFVGPFMGPGHLVDGAGNHRAPLLVEAIAPAAWTPSDGNSILTWQRGDWSRAFPAWESWMSGAATLGQPTTGYYIPEPLTPHAGYLYSSSGWNNATASNIGRTGLFAYRTHIYQAGQGDLGAYNCSGFISSQRGSATSFLAQPAIQCFGGDMAAGADFQYLNPYEMDLQDNGFDVAAIGFVVNGTRTNNGGGQGTYWAGSRYQSNGAKPWDAMVSAAGLYNAGFDATAATFTNQAAVTLAANQRIYFGATNTGGTPAGTVPAGAYVSQAGGALVMSNGAGSAQLSTSQFTVTVPMVSTDRAAATVLSLSVPLTVNSSTYTMGVADSSLIITTTNCTITLQPAASYPGRILHIKTITANSLTSASSNVVPLASASAGSTILAATAGKWTQLQSDGVNWVQMAGN